MKRQLVSALRDELKSLERQARRIRALLAEVGATERDLFDAAGHAEPATAAQGPMPDIGDQIELQKLGMRDAIRFAINNGPPMSAPMDVVKWLESHGYRATGKTKLSNRVRAELFTLTKRGKILRHPDTKQYRLASGKPT